MKIVKVLSKCYKFHSSTVIVQILYYSELVSLGGSMTLKSISLTISYTPTIITLPSLLQALGMFGMYRNHSLNTAMDRSKV